MAQLAAPGDTWGTSGPDFLLGFGAALVILVIFAAVVRRSALRGTTDQAGRLPTPAETALMTQGPRLALFASLAGLRSASAINVDGSRVLSATGHTPEGLSELDRAVLDAAGRGVRVPELATDQRVRPALDAVHESASRAGWLLDDEQRRRARRGAWLLVALAAFGLYRIYAGVSNDRPVLFLIMLVALTAVLAVGFTRVPTLTASGKRAVAELRTRNRHLSPAQSPAWGTYGFAGAAMGVALFGTGALWAADHAFAADLGIDRQSLNQNTASSTTGCGGGDGGGDGGGGGGCGGGCGG